MTSVRFNAVFMLFLCCFYAAFVQFYAVLSFFCAKNDDFLTGRDYKEKERRAILAVKASLAEKMEEQEAADAAKAAEVGFNGRILISC